MLYIQDLLTFQCVTAVTCCCRYFEFEVLTDGPMKVGWARIDAEPGRQIGQDESSWAFDGYHVRQSQRSLPPGALSDYRGMARGLLRSKLLREFLRRVYFIYICLFLACQKTPFHAPKLTV